MCFESFFKKNGWMCNRKKKHKVGILTPDLEYEERRCTEGLENKVGFNDTGKLGAVFSIHGYGHWLIEKK